MALTPNYTQSRVRNPVNGVDQEYNQRLEFTLSQGFDSLRHKLTINLGGLDMAIPHNSGYVGATTDDTHVNPLVVRSANRVKASGFQPMLIGRGPWISPRLVEKH